MLEAMGLFKFDMTYTPMGFEEQMQIFNDNKSGKVGVGIFASLGSFLADNQDKTISSLLTLLKKKRPTNLSKIMNKSFEKKRVSSVMSFILMALLNTSTTVNYFTV